MGIGNFFKGIAAQVNPFDNGKTYGSYNQKKKRPEDDQPQPGQVITPTPKLNLNVQNPNNVFKQPSVDFGKLKTPANQVKVLANDDMPEPQKFVTTAPKQGFWNKVRDVIDSNTETDQYKRGQAQVQAHPDAYKNDNRVPLVVDRRQSPWKTAGDTVGGVFANIPEVGLATGRVATGLVQGAAGLPHDAAAIAATGTEQLANHFNNPVTRQVNRVAQDVNTGTKNVFTNWVGNVINPVNRFLDRSAKSYNENITGGTGGEDAYHATQVPLNALALLLGAGAGEAGEAAGAAGRAGEAGNGAKGAGIITRTINKISSVMNKPVAGTSDDGIISKIGGEAVDKFKPVVEALNAPFKSTKNAVSKAIAARNLRNAAQIEDAALTAGELGNIPSEAGNLLSDSQIDDIVKTTQIPVSTPVEVNAPVDVGTPVNVRTPSNDIPLIQEVGGDANRATTTADIAERARQNQLDDFSHQTFGRPDPALDGVTPRDPAKTITTRDVQVAQQNLDDMLQTGKISDADHADLTNQLKGVETVDGAPKGQPITVKQANTINVEDKTVVPTDLPEKPGTVQVTTQADPAAAKAAEVAAAPPPVDAGTTTSLSDSGLPDTNATSPSNIPRAGESEEDFLKRIAPDVQDNLQRSVRAIKDTKKMTSAERAERVAAGERAYQEAKAAGLSHGEQEAARKHAYRGAYERMGYEGKPVANEDEQRLRDMIDEHYKGLSQTRGDVREAFAKLFHGGEPGYYSEQGNHMIKSDIKKVRQFLNESVPGANLGDAAEAAIHDIESTEKGAGKIAKVLGFQRALRFTADISATARQSLAAGLSHPGDFAGAVKDAFGVMFNPEKYEAASKALSGNKVANYVSDRLGVYLPLLDDTASKADDAFRNAEYTQKIPGVKQVVNASERHYNMMLNSMRMRAAERFIENAGGIPALEKAASDAPDPDAFLKAIGLVTNVNTGRGQVGNLGKDGSKILSNILVSPRGLAARIQRFNHKYYTDLSKANPAAAKEAIRSLVIQASVTAAALGVAAKSGHYEDGQIKVGDTRYDLTGGASNMLRTLVRVEQYIAGSKESNPFNNAEDEITNWAKNQLAPAIATARNLVGIHHDTDGKLINRWGEPVTVGSMALENVVPVGAEQVASDLNQGVSAEQTGVNAGLNSLGLGVNTYQSAADKKAAAQTGGTGTDSAPLKLNSKGVQAEGYSLSESADGGYDYVINGKKQNSSSLKDAREAIAKDALGKSDKAIKIMGGQVFRKSADGNVTVTSKIKYDNSLNAATLTTKKKKNDLEGWLATADAQLQNIQEQLQDPAIDPLDRQTLENDAQTLLDDSAKYQEYGGFTKGGGKNAKQKIETAFGTLGNSPYAPKVKQYDTSAINGLTNIPIIRKVRPNIVHKIGVSG